MSAVLAYGLSESMIFAFLLAAPVFGQEYVGAICGAGAPFCWVPIGNQSDCNKACLGNKDGPQHLPVSTGQFIGQSGQQGDSVDFPHWVCRARGDHHEGWRPGFNLKGYNDGSQVDTACNIAAAAMELSKTEFECQCHAAFQREPVRSDMHTGWLLSMALAASLGAFAANLALSLIAWRSPRAGNVLKPYMEMNGAYSEARLALPLRMDDGLGSM